MMTHFLLRDDWSDSVAKMEAAEKALEEKQKVMLKFFLWAIVIAIYFVNHLAEWYYDGRLATKIKIGRNTSVSNS